MNLSSRNTLAGDAQTHFSTNAFHQNVTKEPSTAPEGLKVFIKNIDETLADSLLESVLAEFGPLKSFRRTRNEKGEPVSFAFAEFEDVTGLINCWRILHKFKLGGKIVEVVINQQAKGALADYVERVKAQISAQTPGLTAEQLDAQLSDRLAAQAPVIGNKLTALVEGFLRNKSKIVKEEKQTGHKLYTEEKLNSHKQKYGLRNARELEELFISELRAWIEKDAQFRVQLERQAEAEKQVYQRKQQLLTKALSGKGDEQAQRRLSEEQKKLLGDDLKLYGLHDIAEFLGIRPEPSPAVSPHLSPQRGDELVPYPSKRAKETTQTTQSTTQRRGPLFKKVEVIPADLPAADAQPRSRAVSSQKALTAPERLAALPLSETILKTPGALKLFQEKMELERAKKELLGDRTKLKALVELRKAIPSSTRELFAAKIDWEGLEKVC